jgi:hypothetical protein
VKESILRKRLDLSIYSGLLILVKIALNINFSGEKYLEVEMKCSDALL